MSSPSLVAAAVLALLLSSPPPAAAQEEAARGTRAPQAMVQVEVATVGVDLASAAPLALLHSEWENVLPIWIGDAEAVAIARALQGVRTPRPMTHDLLVGVMETLGGTLEEVWVTEIREATYHGSLRIRTASGIREVDTRPSDALALAVRTGARIRVAAGLLTDVPEVEFLSADGEVPIVRIRGVTVRSMGAEDRRGSGAGAARGVLVLHATDQVEARGLRRGDVVTTVAGRSTPEALDFLEVMRDQRDAGSVEVTRIRDGSEETIRLPPRRAPARTGE